MDNTPKTAIARPMPRPTAQAAPYVDALGAELAATFLMTYCGAELSLADDPKGHARHEALLGHDKAKALAAQPRLQKRVPLAKRWLAAMLHWRLLHRRNRPTTARVGRVRAPLAEGVARMTEGRGTLHLLALRQGRFMASWNPAF